MKQNKIQWWIGAMLLIVCLAVLAGCGNGSGGGIFDDLSENDAPEIRIDENGYATWSPVEGAVSYEYAYGSDYDGAPTLYFHHITTEYLTLQMYDGYWFQVRAVFSDGHMGREATTGIWGDPALLVDPNTLFADMWMQVSGELRPDEGNHGEDDPVGGNYGEDVPVGDDPNEGNHGEYLPEVDVPVEPSRPAPIVTLSEDGVVKWDVVEGANGYRLDIWSGKDDRETRVYHHTEIVYEPTELQLFDGYGISVSALFGENMIPGEAAHTEIYGDPANRKDMRWGIIEHNYSIRWEQVSAYELIGNIDFNSVVTAEDGSVTFTATGPKGTPMRFYGHGIKLEDGMIYFMPNSFMTALDSIGRIYVYEGKTGKSYSEMPNFWLMGGYTFSEKTSVDGHLDLTYTAGSAAYVAGEPHPYEEKGLPMTYEGSTRFMDYMVFYQPNFISCAATGYTEGGFAISELVVYYDESTYSTPLRQVKLLEDMYRASFEGEKYPVDQEDISADEIVPKMYLVLRPDVIGEINPLSEEKWLKDGTARGLFTLTPTLLSFGDLKDADGRVLDKYNDALSEGAMLEVTIGDYTLDLSVPVLPEYTGAMVMNDLVPYAYPEAVGTINAIVIPVGFVGGSDRANGDEYELFLNELGRVMDADGNVTDHSFDPDEKGRYSLSQYYSISSHGALTINSFVTDWYSAPYTVEEMKTAMPNRDFIKAILEWLYKTYPDMDWTVFDGDKNGYFDSVILVNAADDAEGGYMTLSFNGGFMTRDSYTDDLAGTAEMPGINGYINAAAHLFDHNVLIHEFAHSLGIIDYYDVTYSGIDAVGHFDMQSASHGDWNAYSKYAVGWIEPTVVTDLKVGESVEIEIGAAALTGDAIVIPGAHSDYNGTPFDEYVLIDLYTSDGLNFYDSKNYYGMEGAVGVRIYHIDARMEKRVLTVEGKDGEYPIGTIHFANDQNDSGFYNVELIQAGGVNTFTNSEKQDPFMDADDLFSEGDVFTAEGYGAFFLDGKMDDGTDFGYTIEIVKITEGENPAATVRITRQ